MNNPCINCQKKAEGACNSSDCFATKVYSAYLRSKKEKIEKKRQAETLVIGYHRDVIAKAMKRQRWKRKK